MRPLLLLLLLAVACGSDPKTDADQDGDGYAADIDCDDADADVHPSAAERCDGLDNDCTGAADDGPVDGVLRYLDEDGDGYGALGSGVLACPEDLGFVLPDGDCDDTNANVSPAGDEVCNLRDDDCDGSYDEDAVDAVRVWSDGDGDGFGSGEAEESCAPGAGQATADGDCADDDATRYPGQVDGCDGIDADCDGSVDEDAVLTDWYYDGDGDGAGDPSPSTSACAAPDGWVADDSDCDDDDAAVNPSAAEVCDGVDQDCDGLADDDAIDGTPLWTDLDGDGYGDDASAPSNRCPSADAVAQPGDCDDADPGVHPGASEVCGGGDEDCDGLLDADDPDALDATDWYVDADQDGYGAGSARRGCTAGITEVGTSGDCDDGSAVVHPGAGETCALAGDDDCDGLADDDDPDITGLSDWYADLDADGYGAGAARPSCTAAAGEVGTSGDCDDTDAGISPSGAEICDDGGADEDCDGAADDADPSVSGALAWYADADGDGEGAGAELRACTAPGGTVASASDCDDSDATVSTGGVEVCDALDQDCDGVADDGVPNDGAGCVEPAAPVWDDTITSVEITVVTGSDTYNGTDDAGYVCVTSSDCTHLNNADWNDNEAGAIDGFSEEGLSVARSDLDGMELRISTGADRWEPTCVSVSLEGEPYYCRDSLTVAMGDASGEVLSWDDTERLSCDGCYDAPLTHGPMVGATGTDFVTLWYRTDATRRVAVYVADTEAALGGAAPVHVSWPAAEDDFTDTARIGGLSADTDYWYSLEVEGTRYGPWTFHTRSDQPGPLRVIYGSCSKYDDQPIFDVIDGMSPDVFMFIGDNHYGNTPDLDSNRQNYRAMLTIPERLGLMQHTSILATWDDHDYVGDNTDGSDAGKDDALQAFTEYWANGSYGTADVAGVFSTQELGDVLVVLLDDRYWRGIDDSILGDAQEAWFFDVLRSSDAVFKLVVTGSQWTLQGTGDSWAAFPEAQERFLQLLADEDIGGVVALSGDIHRSEFRLLPGASGGYDLPELTSSPLANSTSGCQSESEIVDCYDDGPSFVALDIDTSLADPTLEATLYDEDGVAQAIWTILRSELE